MPKTYLGDGVYAEVEGISRLWLTTHNGLVNTNAICLEPDVLAALLGYLSRLRMTQERRSAEGEGLGLGEGPSDSLAPR